MTEASPDPSPFSRPGTELYSRYVGAFGAHLRLQWKRRVKDLTYMAGKTIIRAFDLFCGGGGSSIGAKQAGVSPVGGSDAWDIAREAYERNLPGAITYPGDIRDLSTQQVKSDLGEINLLIASPECTHHSVAKGNRPRSEESKRLAYEVIRFARALKPRWIVVENVIQAHARPGFC